MRTDQLSSVASGSDKSRLPEDSKVLCSGHLRVDIPTTWKVTTVKGRGSEAVGPDGEKFELVALRRPDSSISSERLTADETLHTFAALKMARLRETESIKLWPYSSFTASPDYPAASAAVAYKSETGRGVDYAIQYLLAEPDIVFMLTFDRVDSDLDNVERDRARFDAIVRTAKRASLSLYAGAPDCK